MTLRIHMSIHDDDLHNTTAKKNIANGVAGLNSNLKINTDYIACFEKLTVAQFNTNAGTGTATNPEKLNTGIPFTAVIYDVLNEYVEIILPTPAFIKEYRQWGANGNNGNGFFKLQFIYDGIWYNTEFISVSIIEDWTNWITLSVPILTNKIRLVATTLDTQQNKNFIRKLEMRG